MTAHTGERGDATEIVECLDPLKVDARWSCTSPIIQSARGRCGSRTTVALTSHFSAFKPAVPGPDLGTDDISPFGPRPS